jgi:DNA-binding CsgD family transcriptional regulator
MPAGIGMDSYAERARHELLATGEKLRRRRPGIRDELSPQEEQIARLARDVCPIRRSARSSSSARTVEWHLRHMFRKLGISSRRELQTVLNDAGLLIS